MYFYLFSLLGVAVGTAFMLRKRKPARPAKTAEAPNRGEGSRPSKAPDASSQLTLYKSYEVRGFGLKQLSNQTLDPALDSGDFQGLAKCAPQQQDRYAVAVEDAHGRLLGYLSRGNYRLFNTLTHMHAGEVFAWGSLTYQPKRGDWQGQVYIPAGLDDAEIQRLQELLALVKEQKTLMEVTPKSTDTYARLLRNHGQIYQLQSALGQPSGIPYHFPINLLPSMSKQFEAEEAWDALMALEQHQDLLKALNERYRSSTLKRIAKAKQALGKNG